MATRIIIHLVYGFIAAFIGVVSWRLAYGAGNEPYLDRLLIYGYSERLLLGGGFLLGCAGGAWLGRDRPHPLLWMLSGGTLTCVTGFAIATFSGPDMEYDWPMVVFPCIAAFVAAVGARIAGERQPVTDPRPVNLVPDLPRFVIVVIAVVLGAILWPARHVFIPSHQTIVGVLLTLAVIWQEVRIRRLERRFQSSSGASAP